MPVYVSVLKSLVSLLFNDGFLYFIGILIVLRGFLVLYVRNGLRIKSKYKETIVKQSRSLVILTLLVIFFCRLAIILLTLK